MAVSNFKTSSVRTGAKRNTMWDGSSIFIYPGYESIATVNVGSGGQSTITFSSIPSTYKHLQIRASILPSATFGGSMNLRTNGDATNNYSSHYLHGTGSSVVAGGNTLNASIPVGIGIQLSGVRGVAIIDILDYNSTNKYKTVKSFSAAENNSTSGVVTLQSGALFAANGLAAVSSLTFALQSANFLENSTIALYGIL